MGNLDGQIDALHLLQHAQADEAAEGLVVLLEGGGALDRLEERLSLVRDVEGEEGRLGQGKERLHLWRRGIEHALSLELVHEESARDSGREGEHLCHPLLLLVLEVVLEQVHVGDGRIDRSSEGGEDGTRGEGRELACRQLRRERLREGEEADEAHAVEERVARDPEDARQLRMVRRHRLRLWAERHDGEHRMHVLDGAIRLLPQLHVDGRVELREPRLEMRLHRLWCERLLLLPFWVDLRLRLDVVTQDLAQAAELDRALVFEAEAEGLQARVAVELVELCVVAQHVEDGAVRLPQKFEGRRDDLAVGALLAVGEAADGGHH